MTSKGLASWRPLRNLAGADIGADADTDAEYFGSEHSEHDPIAIRA